MYSSLLTTNLGATERERRERESTNMGVLKLSTMSNIFLVVSFVLACPLLLVSARVEPGRLSRDVLREQELDRVVKLA